ncbi:acetoacetate--CoA ligase [Undibacterium sp.]|jgi:acetoacetyl-CoA synthetase|uniref:acetoacetate--CoA ligase n=1 Tax=Undibacterium sp. TaxID=1914977 RepID=UPI002BC1A69F|nr:acetoacetate--CoA ligase [Undibacterium sp.]HTD04943.1 acetoacetate--CoA ligase [Undibacterium sp.]
MNEISSKLLWTPSAERISKTRMYDYQQWLHATRGLQFSDYNALWQWSVEHLEDFWESIWQYFDVRSTLPYTRVLSTHAMPGAHWFEGAHINLAEQLFRFHQDQAGSQRPAIIFQSEPDIAEGKTHTLSWGQMRSQIASVAHALRQMGVQRGDRVAAYLPNIPETVVAFYACASIGAIWSSCSPDMGSPSVLDRFAQIHPKVLIAVDGYRYGGKPFDRLSVVETLQQSLPSVEQVVLLPVLRQQVPAGNFIGWDSLLQHDVAMQFASLPFDHPLWIVYSSGTTGMPKPIVHSQGGTLLETLKGHGLQLDLGEQDRFHWFSTTGWIMWNSQITGLLLGATICLYDGNPGYPDLGTLWKFAEQTETSFLGAGAAYFANCMKAGIQPHKIARLEHIRSVGSTGSPLSEEGFEWIYRQVGSDLMLASISGGTDIAATFVGSCPIMPLYSGEIQSRSLGIAVYAMDEQGKALNDEVGELVVTEPMPSMPLFFWNDPDNRRYLDSYFDVYPGWWRHGDWIRITPRGGAVIYGRSDTTINRHGIRMGTSEIYRAVESLPDVLDSLVVDLEYLGRESYMPLFVVLRAGTLLDENLTQAIKDTIRTALSARHVPNEIFAVAEIPRTLSGKKMELPIKKLLMGTPIDKIANRDAMANPGSLSYFEQFAAARSKTM